MLANAASLIWSHMARRIEMKSLTTPLCMKAGGHERKTHRLSLVMLHSQCRPKTNGWLFTGVTALLDAARMCPRHTLVSVFAQIERKFMSLIGGWTVLYIAGRRPSL